MLYLIIAHAILPPTFEFIPELNGQNAAVILFDPLRHFSVPRLATVILHLLITKLGAPPATLAPSIKASLLTLTERSLSHVHIFQPSSWPSLLSTLHALPTYLFDSTNHKSTHRRIHSLILEDIDAFAWPLRSSSAPASRQSANPLANASRELTAELVKLGNLLQCNVVLTSPSILPSKCWPALPTQWPSGVRVTRLGVRRVEVLRFAPEMGVEQACGEGAQRWDVVRRGRFEVWRAGTGVGDDGDGFVFRVGPRGVEIEKDGG